MCFVFQILLSKYNIAYVIDLRTHCVTVRRLNTVRMRCIACNRLVVMEKLVHFFIHSACMLVTVILLLIFSWRFTDIICACSCIGDSSAVKSSGSGTLDPGWRLIQLNSSLCWGCHVCVRGICYKRVPVTLADNKTVSQTAAAPFEGDTNQTPKVMLNKLNQQNNRSDYECKFWSLFVYSTKPLAVIGQV